MKNTMMKRWNKMQEGMEALSDKIYLRIYMTFSNSDGIGVVELILILVVLIGLVLLFKSQLLELVESIFDTITNESSNV